MALEPGSVVGGYRIQSLLGAGGMGTVYLAEHPSLPRMDAIKILSPELSNDTEFRARFEREANIAAGLDHPNIVSVYNRGEEEGRLWIAMQYVEGTDAGEEVKRGPQVMTPDRALRIVSEVGKGLDYAHRRGLLHRDVKPANFLLSSVHDDEERVLLTDFGVAKSADDNRDLTATGSFMATVAFAPPEQLSGQPLDYRADIYSLGCSLFKLLTGQNPYPSQQPAMVMMAHLTEPPPSVTRLRPDLPRGIDAVVARAMAKDPNQRFASCRELAQATADALAHRPVGRAPEPTVQYMGDLRPRTGLTGPQYMGDPHSRTGFTGPQHMHETRGTTGSGEIVTAQKSKLPVVVAATVAVVLLAVVAGIFLVRGGDNDPQTAQTTSAVPTKVPKTVAEARVANPQFAGKRITVFDFTGADPFTGLAVYLGTSQQAEFFKSLGFLYNDTFAGAPAEPSPRKIDTNSTEMLNLRSDVIVVIRSDPQAGGGGQRGLPRYILNARSIVLPFDDPVAVNQFRTWTDMSDEAMVEKMVPTIAQQVK